MHNKKGDLQQVAFFHRASGVLAKDEVIVSKGDASCQVNTEV